MFDNFKLFRHTSRLLHTTFWILFCQILLWLYNICLTTSKIMLINYFSNIKRKLTCAKNSYARNLYHLKLWTNLISKNDDSDRSLARSIQGDEGSQDLVFCLLDLLVNNWLFGFWNWISNAAVCCGMLNRLSCTNQDS